MINTINYSNAILIERINMFINFMEAFNKHHTKYFLRLLNKSNLINDMINEDIHITNKEELSPPLSPATSTSNIINKSEDTIIDTNTENSNISFTIIDTAINEFNNNVNSANDNSSNENSANENSTNENNDNDEVPFSV